MKFHLSGVPYGSYFKKSRLWAEKPKARNARINNQNFDFNRIEFLCKKLIA